MIEPPVDRPSGLVSLTRAPAVGGRHADVSADAPALLARLEGQLHRFPALVIAFSGGVDSAVLLAAAHRTLGTRAMAVIADSASLPRAELQHARDVAQRIGAELHEIRTTEVDRPEYIANDRNRCYFCKQTLFDACTGFALQHGIADLAYGYTLDDASDDRPGHRAASEFGVHAPLFDAGLRKPDVRAVARALGLPVWDKPAAPCLSSRIPHGTPVTRETLGAIEAVEEVLHRLGFTESRARFDGISMRIEVPVSQIAELMVNEVREDIVAAATNAGVRYISLDLEGFSSGKLTRRGA